MADLDLEGLSLKDLKQLQKDIVKAIASFEERSKAEARLKVEAFARELGYPLSELVNGSAKRRCCKTLSPKDSHCESMRLDGAHEQAISCPLPHDELVQLHCSAAQTRLPAALAGQGDDLARAA